MLRPALSSSALPVVPPVCPPVRKYLAEPGRVSLFIVALLLQTRVKINYWHALSVRHCARHRVGVETQKEPARSRLGAWKEKR